MRTKTLVTCLLSTFLAQLFVTGAVCAELSMSEKSFPNSAVEFIQWPDREGGNTTPIGIVKDTSEVFRFDRPIVRVAISNPAICDVTTVGEKEVLVNAKQAGLSNLLIWDESESIATYRLSSTLNLEKLWRILDGIDPNGSFNILPFNETVAVYGTTGTSGKLKQITDATKAFDKNALCYVRLKESKQVMLEVRFAEVNRKASKDQKLDLEAIAGFFSLRSLSGQTGATGGTARSFTAFQNGAAYSAMGLGAETVGNLSGTYISSAASIAYFLKWLEQKNILKFIARPNLVAKDGEEASFVVGGEFPIPSTSTNGVQINYKEFGTKLKFTPEILDDDVIRLKTDSEVSELDFSTTVTSGGATVPSIIKRNHQTIAELKDNESLMIGGLISQKITNVSRKVPFLGDIPVAKALFNSTEFLRTDVELLVVITPHIVRPMKLNETKTFYNENEIKNAIRVFSPSYPDAQADGINRMITENETARNFDEDEANKFAKTVANRLDQKSSEQWVKSEAQQHKKSSIASPPLKSPQARRISPAVFTS